MLKYEYYVEIDKPRIVIRCDSLADACFVAKTMSYGTGVYKAIVHTQTGIVAAYIHGNPQIVA